MQLKYHAATYALLTGERFETAEFVAGIRSYYEQVLDGYVRTGQATDAIRADFARQFEDATAWTRIDLYQRPLQISAKNVALLDALESKYAVALPAAVREWYSLDIAPEIMGAVLPEFGFQRIETFKPFAEMPEQLTLLSPPAHLWYFLHSEYIDQGGERVAFDIAAGDDPPVYAADNRELVLLAPAFSAFIHAHFRRWYDRRG